MNKIGIIAPSGLVENFNYDKTVAFFNSFGIEVKIFDSCISKFRYMAGDDELRLNDLHCAFLDSSIDTIVCARGGYGAIRLLDKIDYDLISKNKKAFVGFSDITLLLIAFYKYAGLKSFHGKMAVNGVINMDEEEFLTYRASIENPSFKSTLTGGILWGGNLASIVSLLGSSVDYLPDEPIILFVEDINEPDYKIDRMFNQILMNKKLASSIKGVIFGEFIGAGKYLDEIQKEFVLRLGVPYEYNLNITHSDKNITVPFGYKI